MNEIDLVENGRIQKIELTKKRNAAKDH